MDTRKIGGEGGLQVSIVGVGCNAFGKRVDEKGTHAVIDAALDAEITFFDTAESYGGGLSEEYIGTGIKGRRNQLQLATKFGHSHSNVEGKAKGSADNVKFTADKALKALRTDYIDLFQQHRPDPDTPVTQTKSPRGISRSILFKLFCAAPRTFKEFPFFDFLLVGGIGIFFFPER